MLGIERHIAIAAHRTQSLQTAIDLQSGVGLREIRDRIGARVQMHEQTSVVNDAIASEAAYLPTRR